MTDPLSFQLGDVVRLETPLGEIDAGLWVVTGRDWLITLNRLGENEDADYCTILPQVRLTLDEAAQLVSMHFNIDDTPPVGEDSEE